jgi:hypothetical protein
MQIFALYVTMGLLLAGVGFTYDTWQFWCFLALFWAISYTARNEGRYESVQIIFDVLESMNIDLSKVVDKLKEKAK